MKLNQKKKKQEIFFFGKFEYLPLINDFIYWVFVFYETIESTKNKFLAFLFKLEKQTSFFLLYNYYFIIDCWMITSILNNLINLSFINRYTDTFQQSPLKVLEKIKKMSCSKFQIEARSNFIKDFETKINQIQIKLGSKQQFNLDKLLQSMRNTEFNMFVTQLLFSNIENRKKIEDIRRQTLESLRDGAIDQDSFNLLYNIYKKIFFGNQSLSFQRVLTIEGRKTFKTILTSLKKMIIVSKLGKNKKLKTVSTQPYYVNVDTRNILEACLAQAQSSMEKSIIIKLQNLLHQKKKWVGPRIWKIVQENEWTVYQIEMLINLIENNYKTLNNFKSAPKQLKKHIQKITSNLRTLINVFTNPCETDIFDSQMRQIYSQFEQMNKIQDFNFEFKDIQQIEDRFLKQKQKQEILYGNDQSSFWL